MKGGVEVLVDRWINEPGFKDRMLNDADSTVRGSGIELSADDWLTLRNVLWSLADEELKPRVSKTLTSN